MKKHLLVTIILFSAFNTASAQINLGQVMDAARIALITDSIATEGRMLALSEIASWYGSDVFLERCKGRIQRIGGYLSYDTGTGMNNVFFSKDDKPVVLATMSFSYTEMSAASCKIDSTERKLTSAEAELYNMRKVAMQALIANKDSVFRFYRNTGINPIPIIIKGQKRVYFLTSPKTSGEVIFGNDYLLTLDNNNHVFTTKKLHNNLITTSTKKSPGDTSRSVQVAGVHTHKDNTSPFMTATDICTIILYQRSTTWKQYYVLSDSYVSVWDLQKHNLSVITKEAWDKIIADQKTRHPAVNKN